MARPLRIQSEDLHYHVIVRCNNRAFRFNATEDFQIYLGLLKTVKEKHRFTLFNYELMHSHVHLFLRPSEKVPLQKTMNLINGRYAVSYNKRYGRKGHFWMDRYKSIPVESDKHALDLMRYINRNAIRAGIVCKPGDWRWSGYRFYALGEANNLLEAHPTYLGLHDDQKIRQQMFYDYVHQILPHENERRRDLSDSKCIGSKKFADRLGLSANKNFRTIQNI